MGEAERIRTSLSPRPSLPGFGPVEKAVDQLAQAGREARGAVFARREVVDFILDLVGYTPDRRLHEHVLLEPSFGDGEFLLAATERLLAASAKHLSQFHEGVLEPCIRAVELDASAYEVTCAKLHAHLCDAGISPLEASKLVDTWLIHNDFLLADLPSSFDFIDLWTAFREGAFGEQTRPFVGWLILLEDVRASRAPVRDTSPNFPIFPEFNRASYADRYSILCRKLVQERLYSVASLLLSPRAAVDTGEYSELAELTGLRTFVTGLAGHIAVEAVR